MEFPDLTFIAGHMGGDDYERAAVRFREVDNVYLEICSSSPDRGKIETVVRDIGSERVVFGSDSTLLNPAVLLGMVVDSEISEEDKVRILYSNARGFLER